MLNATGDKTRPRGTTAQRSFPAPEALGRPIRVLIVDDSVVIRRLVTQVLSEDPAIEVAGVAANGIIALARIPQVNPDVVSLDIEMPEMDGIETLRRIRKQFPAVRVIMFSTLTARGADKTLEALSLGANDYVTKPANVGSLDRSMEKLRGELIPKIKQFFETALPPPASLPAPAAVKPVSTYTPVVPYKPEVVAIGVSTGGPNALAQIFPEFPADFPLPILVVQHMPPLFTRMLAERLCNQSHLQVVEAADGMAVEPGHAFIAPGDYHMQVLRRDQRLIVRLDQGPPQNSCRPAVDVLFSSLAKVCGGRVLGVVLTGMGHDGLRGAQELKSQGASVLAQDQASSVVWGMPGAVATAGLADKVLTLKGVVPEILRRVKSK